jgi:CBS domain-containing protein
LGGLAGQVFQRWFGPELSPSTFALCGAAALLVGIQRSTVSHCVILVEGTGQVKVLIPVIVTAVIASSVASWIHEKGLFDSGLEVKNFPYLEHRDKKLYDVILVKDIMSSAPQSLGSRERAGALVKLLRESYHSGFPVVEPGTGKLHGLVRRDQLVALLECGIFDDEQEDDENSWEMPPTSSNKEHLDDELFHMAYHIKDDRYEHLSTETNVQPQPKQSKPRTTQQQNEKPHSSTHRAMAVGDGPLPPLRPDSTTGSVSLKDDGSVTASCTDSKTGGTGRDGCAVVGTNDQGTVFIQWMAPEYRRRLVNVAAVMNQGTYTVTELCPVSKAYYLFTALGLRHLIVLGGESGGEVAGILTRINFLEEFIEERTGYRMY